jgi:AcrR family transcriptional regulator
VLSQGIDGTTKEMIARSSGLSRKSIDRYFTEKPAYMLKIAKRIGDSVWKSVNGRYSNDMFTGGKYTGADLLEMYMQDIKSLFMHKTSIFVFYMEFKIYFSRHDSNYVKDYQDLSNSVGCKRLVESIFILGQIDGSLSVPSDPSTEADSFCRAYLSFLSDMALSYEDQKEETVRKIDRYIDRMLNLYRRD